MNNFTRKDAFSYCCYYQAEVSRPDSWFVVAVLKSFDHMSLDRTIDRERSVFEFFVPSSMERYFLQVINYLQQQGYIRNLQKLPNRLQDSSQEV